MLSYWFYPNPGNTSYRSSTVIVVLGLCLTLIIISFLISVWRAQTGNAVTRRLTRSWPSVLRWFGLTGVVLTVSRVEEIQFLAMRALWLLWLFAFLCYVLFQIWWFRRRHYTVVKKEKIQDEREKYLPGGGR